jgi:DNA-binding MarR family transcriptional regulator
MENEESLTQNASKLADLTYSLLGRCQEKEVRLAEQYGLTQAEFRCLRLFNANEIINNKHMAERMNLSPSRLTRIIDGLVKKGYLNREIDNVDRRNMRVYLSKQGEEIVKVLNSSYLDIHMELLQDIEPSQHQQLISAMTSLLSALNKWTSKA